MLRYIAAVGHVRERTQSVVRLATLRLVRSDHRPDGRVFVPTTGGARLVAQRGWAR